MELSFAALRILSEVSLKLLEVVLKTFEQPTLCYRVSPKNGSSSPVIHVYWHMFFSVHFWYWSTDRLFEFLMFKETEREQVLTSTWLLEQAFHMQLLTKANYKPNYVTWAWVNRKKLGVSQECLYRYISKPNKQFMWTIWQLPTGGTMQKPDHLTNLWHCAAFCESFKFQMWTSSWLVYAKEPSTSMALQYPSTSTGTKCRLEKLENCSYC